MPRVYDLLLLDSELDALRDRLVELAGVPGLVHVICEAPITPGGDPKPLWFWENRNTGRFKVWHGRWNHVRVEPDEMPGRTPAEREAAQREYLLHGFHGGPGDILLWGDVAEIPDPAAVTGLACRRTAPPVMLGGTVACRRGDIGSIAELEEMRRELADHAAP
jgi:hypothetical protein